MYRLAHGGVIRLSDMAYIPDGSTIDWQEYQDFVAAGNTPGPYVEPEKPKVQEVTPHQAQMALLHAGLLDDVETAIESITDPTEKRIAKIDWEKASVIRRDWPLLNQLSSKIGITEEQLDSLFESAASL